jgi:hypothetical protein
MLFVAGCKSRPSPAVTTMEAGTLAPADSPPAMDEPRVEVLPLPNERPCPPSFSKEGCAEFLRGSDEMGSPLRRDRIQDAERVVAGMRLGFRACYNEGRRQDPNLAGSLVIVATIGPAGEVVSASPTTNTGLKKEVVDCLLRRVKAAQFAYPSTRVKIPITLVRE